MRARAHAAPKRSVASAQKSLNKMPVAHDAAAMRRVPNHLPRANCVCRRSPAQPLRSPTRPRANSASSAEWNRPNSSVRRQRGLGPQAEASPTRRLAHAQRGNGLRARGHDARRAFRTRPALRAGRLRDARNAQAGARLGAWLPAGPGTPSQTKTCGVARAQYSSRAAR